MDKYTIKKIPLADFIEKLSQLWDMGADYADLTLIPKGGDYRDEIIINVEEEYYSDENGEDEEDASIKSIDDMNKLIG